MTTQVVTGVLVTKQGTIPLEVTATDAQENEILTSASFTVSAQSIGTYAAGQQAYAGYVSSATGIQYAYVLRNGRVLSVFPSLQTLTSGGGGQGAMPLAPFTIQPGDQIRVLTYVD
jgi:hypothetical protein